MEETNVKIFEKFIWKIENFSRLNTKELYSDPFILCGYPWRILVFPKGIKDDNLPIYLEAVQTANMCKGWSRDVKFKLLVFNHVNENMTITQETKHELNSSQKNWGFHTFMSLAELHDPTKGFIVKDTCNIGAEVLVSKVTHENQVNQQTHLNVTPPSEFKMPKLNPQVQGQNMQTIFSPVSTIFCTEPTKDTYAKLFSPTIEEIMDFCSIGELSEGCSQHPKISCKFMDLAFAALGRVLYFLKTRKVKDMNEQACKDLQVLWDEVEKFRFDVTWLEPHVQYALGIKSYVEKALEVENLEENVIGLVLETEKLKAKLVEAEVNLDIERELLKEKGYKEMDLNSELRYGNWLP